MGQELWLAWGTTPALAARPELRAIATRPSFCPLAPDSRLRYPEHMITTDDVKKLADLARLNLTDEEVERYTTDLGSVIQYIEQLSEVDVAGVEPTSQVTGLQNVLREDVVVDGMALTHDEQASFVPHYRDKQVVVPLILNKDAQ